MEVEVKDRSTSEPSQVECATGSKVCNPSVRGEGPTPIAATTSTGARRVRIITLSILFAGILVGLWARLDGLGTRQLAVDEYYFVRSVDLVLDRGVPKFPTGGYYTRGLLQQYLTAGCVLVLGKSDLAYRLPSLFFSLLSLALFYVYSRRYMGQALAAAVTLTLLVSSWHIEFARFARMYSAFQCTTLLFLLSFDQAFFQHKRKWLLAPHLSALLATLTHAMGVLLTPVLFLPFLLSEGRRLLANRRSVFLYGLATLTTTILCVVLAQFNFRYVGVEDPFPPDYELVPEAPFQTSAFPFWSISENDVFNLAFVVGTLITVAGILWLLRQRARISSVDILLSVLLLSTAFHAFSISLGCLFVLVFRYQIHRPLLHARRSYWLMGLSLLTCVGWIGYSLATAEWIGRVDMGSLGLLGAFRRTFLGWPDFHKLIYRPWGRELPMLGTIAAGAIIYQLASKIRRPIGDLVRKPALFLAYITLCLGVLHSPYSASRYSFFVYPVILLVVALSVSEIGEKWVRRVPGWDRPVYHTSLASVLYVLLFGLTSDFNPSHIANISSPEVSYRKGQFERFERTWYSREDFESPALFVNQVVESGEAKTVIVVNSPPVSYYLRGEHAVYCERSNQVFGLISRVQGTVELWSNQRLLSTTDDLRSYTENREVVWIIKPVAMADPVFAIEAVWAEELAEASRVFLSSDGRIEVVRVQLR